MNLQGIVPMMFAKSAECLAVTNKAVDTPSARTFQQIQFNFLINKKKFLNDFNSDEAELVKTQFQDSMQRVFNGMSALKSIEFTGFRNPKVFESRLRLKN